VLKGTNQANSCERLIEMANENIERQMEFLLQQQAQSASRMEQLEEAVALFVKGTQDLVKGTQNRFEAHEKRFDEVDEKIAALVDSQIHTEEIVKETAGSLRTLIAVVDRYFEGRNGNSQS
jgi:hypothetical protein